MVGSASILATKLYIPYAEEAKKGVTIAVKVTDMLGDEVLVVKSV